MGLEVPLYGPLGIIISQILFTFPQAFLILSVALSMADYRLYEAADSLGLVNLRSFAK
ncbi:short chain dehydrogenase domain protein [Clostridioides difficile Y231]|nr:short chain dehydrogenase domain protein [Clostridioides difficile Y231]